ncbi:uncharacterized protein N7529_006628 [Penicillium soppii]|uniref:uncharacterized protein n=1 Tax=Penicillium soppii TaxID=69789 RepID=UPI002547E52F|nr:uncharacterized protein N7529_006628 [Penicillium soppii]KAJ5864712.1 hypothetical protein N7529_006628 [Penicillium soppii]
MAITSVPSAGATVPVFAAVAAGTVPVGAVPADAAPQLPSSVCLSAVSVAPAHLLVDELALMV